MISNKFYNINEQVEDAIFNKQSNIKNYLGVINQSTARKIKKLTGIDVTGRKHVLTSNDIRHMINNHSNKQIESSRNQIAITKDDIKNIPNILFQPDCIEKGSFNREGASIRYVKTYDNTTSYVVEVVPVKGNFLKIKTMWKQPFTLTHAPNKLVLCYTPKAEGDADCSTSFNGNNITQSNKNVNLLPTNNMSICNDFMTLSDEELKDIHGGLSNQNFFSYLFSYFQKLFSCRSIFKSW